MSEGINDRKIIVHDIASCPLRGDLGCCMIAHKPNPLAEINGCQYWVDPDDTGEYREVIPDGCPLVYGVVMRLASTLIVGAREM